MRLASSAAVLALVLALVLAFALVPAGGAAAQCLLEGVRFSAADGVRIVADLTAAAEYEVFALSGPDRLVVDISPCRTAAVDAAAVGAGPVIRVRTAQHSPDTVRLVLDLDAAADYHVFHLRGPDRVVIDVAAREAVAPPSPLRALEDLVMERAEPPAAAPVPRPGPEPGAEFEYWSETRPLDRASVQVHVVRIPAEHAGRIRLGLDPRGIGHTSPLSVLAEGVGARVAVNGGFFTSGGVLVGMRVLDGKALGHPARRRPVFGVTARGRTMIFNPGMSVDFEWRGIHRQRVRALNEPLHLQNAVIYTEEYGIEVDYFDNYHVRLLGELIVGVSYGPFFPRERPGYTLALHRYLYEGLASPPQVGNRGRIVIELDPPVPDLMYAVEGGPTLMSGGRYAVDPGREMFDRASGIVNGRQPRTALGIGADGSVFWVVADGRQRGSAGMSLDEMVSFLKTLGVVDAMLLDGGGSSTLWIHGRVVNSPSGGSERAIPDFLYLP